MDYRIVVIRINYHDSLNETVHHKIECLRRTLRRVEWQTHTRPIPVEQVFSWNRIGV